MKGSANAFKRNTGDISELIKRRAWHSDSPLVRWSAAGRPNKHQTQSAKTLQNR